MSQESTLHIKLDLEMDEQLAALARSRKSSKGRLVRDAIVACYQFPAEELPIQQQRALAAYQGGYISIGKLAEAMGLHVLDLRTWLGEHGLGQNTVMSLDDHINA
jgi:predicted transcriptional regulator